MLRKYENGHLSFDASAELGAAGYEIKNILATLNPDHPNTLQAILDIVRWYGQEIDRAWSQEYTDRTLKDAELLSRTTIAATLAGIRIEKEKTSDEDN